MDLDKLKELLQNQTNDVNTQVKELMSQGAKETDEKLKPLQDTIKTLEDSIKNIKEQKKQIDLSTVSGMEDHLKTNPFDWGCYLHAIKLIGRSYDRDKAWDDADAGNEKEIIDQYAKRVESMPARQKQNIAGDGSQGGYLIPPEVTSEIIGLAIANMPIKELGARFITGLVGDLPVPTATGRPSGFWLGENEAPTSSQAAFGQVTLRPKKAGAFVKVSNRLIFQSRGVADRVIKDLLAEEMQLTLEGGYISGTGTNSEPLGIENQSANFTASTVTVTGNRFRHLDGAQMTEDIDVANELKPVGNYGFLMHPRVKGGLKRQAVQQFSGQGEVRGMPVVVGNPILNNAQLEDVMGYPTKSSTLVTSNRAGGANNTFSNVYFGNWALFWIGMWRDMIVRVSDVAGDSSGSAFTEDQSWIVAFQETDCQLMRGGAFTRVTGCDTTPGNWS